MAKPEDIITQIKTILEDDTTLSDYVKGGVMLGVRDSIVVYPCIIIEPLGSEESDDTYPTQRITYRFAIHCFLKTLNKDKQIVGDDKEKGIINFENDVKKALSSDKYLNSLVISSRVTGVRHDEEMPLFPIRNFVIEFETFYQQNATTRT